MISEKNKYLFFNFMNLLLKEKFKKKLNFEWNNYSLRFQIMNKIIKIKNYKKYLEIGCYKDENFNNINIAYKVGVDPVSGNSKTYK